MDFSAIFQLRSKRYWWMDVIFYFAASLLVAAVFCYALFLFKNSLTRKDTKEASLALETVGTKQQKEYEKEVLNYQKKLLDFSTILNGHQFASNVFLFLEQQTRPNIWFNQFILDEKNATVQLSGEADDLDAFSRQVAIFEGSKYVKSVSTLNSSAENSAKIGFNINLALNQEIFSYASVAALVPVQPEAQLVEEETAQEFSGEQEAGGEGDQTETTAESTSSEKNITSFRLLLSPDVMGQIDQDQQTVKFDVPFGTNVKNIRTSITVSQGAKIVPASGVAQDFTDSVKYAVSAQDGSTQNYTVSVSVKLAPVKKSNSIVLIMWAAIILIGALASGAVLYFLILKPKQKKF